MGIQVLHPQAPQRGQRPRVGARCQTLRGARDHTFPGQRP
jgi:hypothetical protein